MPTFHTSYADGTTQFTAAHMNAPLLAIDKVLGYHHNKVVYCEGNISYDLATGILAWTGIIKINFIASNGNNITNTIAAGSITLADNEYAYANLVETENSALTVAKATLPTNAASTTKTVERVVLGYRAATGDRFFPVALPTPIFAGTFRNNISALTNPTITDDGTKGYGVGSYWINTVTKVLFTCFDSTTGAAVWRSGAGLLDNLSATTSPTASDDSADGYSVGSMWVDTTNDEVFICVDATAAAAKWRWIREELLTIASQAFAATMNINVDKQEIIDITMTNNATINFSGARDGQSFILRIRQDAVGGRIVTWGTMCRASLTVALPVLSIGANKLDYIGFRYNAADGKYDIMAANKGF